MAKKDDIAAAELAGLVGGHLKGVESKMINRSSTDVNGPIDPRDFLGNINKGQRQTTSNAVIPSDSIIEQPKSRPVGSEVVGVENVNLQNLMIPMDGADKDMREAIARHGKEASSLVPTPIKTPTKEMVVGSVVPIQNKNVAVPIENNLMEILNDINKKLDLLLKRAKIQPRYKKVSKK